MLFWFFVWFVSTQTKFHSLFCQSTNSVAVWDMLVTQGGSECWSDKLGHLSVSVSLFLEQLPPVMSDTNYLLLQIGSVCTSHPGVMSVSCTSVCFFLSSCLAPFFPVTCCSQLSILPVLWSISCQRRAALLSQVCKKSNPLMTSRHRTEVGLPINLQWSVKSGYFLQSHPEKD